MEVVASVKARPVGVPVVVAVELGLPQGRAVVLKAAEAMEMGLEAEDSKGMAVMAVAAVAVVGMVVVVTAGEGWAAGTAAAGAQKA